MRGQVWNAKKNGDAIDYVSESSVEVFVFVVFVVVGGGGGGGGGA
jgi:hypothetical protein